MQETEDKYITEGKWKIPKDPEIIFRHSHHFLSLWEDGDRVKEGRLMEKEGNK